MDSANRVPMKVAVGRVLWNWSLALLCLIVGVATLLLADIYLTSYQALHEPSAGPLCTCVAV